MFMGNCCQHCKKEFAWNEKSLLVSVIQRYSSQGYPSSYTEKSVEVCVECANSLLVSSVLEK